MQKNVRRLVLFLAAAVFAFSLVGCGTLPGAVPGSGKAAKAAPGQNKAAPGVTKAAPGQSKAAPVATKAAPTFSKGQVVDIVGKVVMNKNQVTLQDQNSPALFRFVGLKPAEQKTLTSLAGKSARVRLKVISTESANAYNAQFMQISG